MRILIAQTTRMGDVLQTSPLIRAVRRKYPDAHIVVMVRNMGKTIAERNPDVDEVLVYDEDAIFINLRARDSDRLLKAYETADAFIHKLRNYQFDIAYNCTHSIASAMMMKLVGIPEVIGADLSDDWQFVLRGAWINYFFTSVFHREYNDLNLCDITRHFVPEAAPFAELVFETKPEDETFAQELCARHGVTEDDFMVCFQLGASEENKRWAETQFAGLAKKLHERYNAKIFLLGVREEEGLGHVFEQHAPNLAVPLYGKTNIPQVAALLKRARLLVTNDTGTMHIAASIKCPVVLVSVGYVHFRETGPYGAGHCAVEWRREFVGRADGVHGGLDERAAIQPDHVLCAMELTMANDSNAPVRQLDVTPELSEIDLHITRFAPDGCLEWYPVLRRPLNERDLLRIAYRAMWLDHLGSEGSREAERESIAAMLGYYAAPEPAQINTWKTERIVDFDQLAELGQKGIDETEKLIENLTSGHGARRAQQQVQTLMVLDEEMRLFSELHNACKPLTLIAKFERENLEGADPVVLAQTTLQIYQDCFARARMMRTKLDLLFSLLP